MRTNANQLSMTPSTKRKVSTRSMVALFPSFREQMDYVINRLRGNGSSAGCFVEFCELSDQLPIGSGLQFSIAISTTIKGSLASSGFPSLFCVRALISYRPGLATFKI